MTTTQPTAPPAPQLLLMSTNSKLAAFGAACTIVGSFGPWVELGAISRSGMGGDGYFTVAAGLIVAYVMYSRKAPGALTLILGALTVLVGGYHLNQITKGLDQLGFLSGAVTIGWGLYSVIVGGALMFIAALLQTMEAK